MPNVCGSVRRINIPFIFHCYCYYISLMNRSFLHSGHKSN